MVFQRGSVSSGSATMHSIAFDGCTYLFKDRPIAALLSQIVAAHADQNTPMTHG